MRYSILLSVFLLTVTSNLFSQTEEIKLPRSKGAIYLTWGYHRNQYTKSTLHLRDKHSDNYDFILYDAKAKDQPDMDHLLKTPLTVPQYVLRVGYMFNNKKDWGIEFSWDHLKYVVRDNQMMHLKGFIHEQYFDKDTLVTPDFVHFEHTNGNNYAMLSFVKRNTFFEKPHQKLSIMTTLGAGALIPKTDSRIMGNSNDGPFRYSGIVFATSAGLRYEIFKYFYIEPSFKAAFADYTNAKVYLQGRVHHTFFSAQYVLAAGINIPL